MFHVFYHMYCGCPTWKPIVREHFMRILMSSVYEAACKIHCFAICPDGIREEVRDFVQSLGEKFVLEDTTESGTEWFCLQRMADFLEPDDKVLYLHSKGVTRVGQECYEHVQSWVDLMHYFLLSKYKECMECLEHCEVVGVNMWIHPTHFSGNFWYAQGRYIKSLDTTQQISAEEWVLHTDERTLVACPHTSYLAGEMYTKSIPVASYVTASPHFRYYRWRHYDFHESDLGKSVVLNPFEGETLPAHSIKLIGQGPSSVEMMASQSTEWRYTTRVNQLIEKTPKIRKEKLPIDKKECMYYSLGIVAKTMEGNWSMFPQFGPENPLHLEKLYNMKIGLRLTLETQLLTILYDVNLPTTKDCRDWVADHFEEHPGFALGYVDGQLVRFD